VAHFIPGLTDFSSEIWGGPEWLVRKLVGLVHKRLINAVTPGKDAELAYIAKLTAATPAPAVEPLAKGPAYDEIVKTVTDGLVALPRLHLDRAKASAMVERVIQLLHLVSHERARIAATMAVVYKEVDLFTPLLVDYDAWSNDKPETKLVDQIEAHG